jgi:hypothetical protein
MAYLLSRFEACYTKASQILLEENDAPKLEFLKVIHAKIESDLAAARQETESVILNLSTGAPSSSSSGSSSLRASGALQELSHKKKSEVLWKAADHQGTDIVELGGSKSFEHTQNQIYPGVYVLKFGLIPQASLMSVTFEVVVENKAGVELLNATKKQSPGDEEEGMLFSVSQVDVHANLKFRAVASLGIKGVKLRASLTQIADKKEKMVLSSNRVTPSEEGGGRPRGQGFLNRSAGQSIL